MAAHLPQEILQNAAAAAELCPRGGHNPCPTPAATAAGTEISPPQKFQQESQPGFSKMLQQEFWLLETFEVSVSVGIYTWRMNLDNLWADGESLTSITGVSCHPEIPNKGKNCIL